MQNTRSTVAKEVLVIGLNTFMHAVYCINIHYINILQYFCSNFIGIFSSEAHCSVKHMQVLLYGFYKHFVIKRIYENTPSSRSA